jgi:hypothetical protein
VLWGDSHAAEWQPALAAIGEAQGFELVTQTKSSCRSVLAANRHGTGLERACAAWRDAVLDDLAAHPPAAVILGNYASTGLGGAAATPEAWADGVRATVAALPASTRVIVLADTPDVGRSPIPCLSRNVESAERCTTSAASALETEARTAIKASATATRAAYIDVNRYLCDDSCPPVIGSTLVYRDGSHLTATFAAELAGPLGEELRPALGPALR